MKPGTEGTEKEKCRQTGCGRWKRKVRVQENDNRDITAAWKREKGHEKGKRTIRKFLCMLGKLWESRREREKDQNTSISVREKGKR